MSKDRASILHHLGFIADALGEKQRALDYYEQALPLRRQAGDKGGEATTLNNIGGVYYALGEKAQALQYYATSRPCPCGARWATRAARA